MKIALRMLLAMTVAFAVAACKSTPEPEETTPVVTDTQPTEPVVTEAAPDPRDYTDARNFENSESLLSKRVIYFDFDKSDVKAEYRSIVAAHAAYMASSSSARVTLEGHADERGTREYNLALGERRANAVKEYLVSRGVSANRIETISYGKERPAVLGSNESAWQQNRRGVSVVRGGAS